MFFENGEQLRKVLEPTKDQVSEKLELIRMLLMYRILGLLVIQWSAIRETSDQHQ